MVKKPAPVESPVTRFDLYRTTLVRSRFLEWTGMKEDAPEDTYDGLQPTGMMGRDQGTTKQNKRKPTEGKKLVF